jgi:hypothetical protein
MQLIISLLFIVVGIIHLLPLPGVLGGAGLAALYGLAFDDANLTLLLRHRAVLFGLLGAFLIYAAFARTWQPLALVAGFVSVVSFLVLAWPSSAYNVAIQRVFLADVVALVCLVVAALLYVVNRA